MVSFWFQGHIYFGFADADANDQIKYRCRSNKIYRLLPVPINRSSHTPFTLCYRCLAYCRNTFDFIILISFLNRMGNLQIEKKEIQKTALEEKLISNGNRSELSTNEIYSCGFAEKIQLITAILIVCSKGKFDVCI